MKLLLINPNRYQSPPVPPIGLEHLAAHLEKEGHSAEVLDLCFSDSPYGEIDKSIKAFAPDIAGVTVRNVDTVLYQTNEFFLEGIRGVIEYVKSRYGLKVLIGGTGVSTDPEGVLEYLGADYAVAGPAEGAMDEALREILSPGGRKIFRRRYRYDVSCPRKRGAIDYRKYFALGGIAGFETHKGCGSSCVYCSEADTRVSFKGIDDVLAEIKGFVDEGFTRFHLCDSEFNEDLEYCLAFCSALIKSGLKIDWAAYMKPANYSRKLIRLMKGAGCSLITLTVDSWKKCPLYWADIEKIIFSAKSEGIKIMVDFLTGFPYETEDTLSFYLDLFRRVRPEGVGINTYIRLYRSLQITKTIMGDATLRQRLIGYKDGDTMVKPVFYCHIGREKIGELIKGEEIFRIEGETRGVNYCR